VSRLTLSGSSFDHCLAEFLDEFRAAPNGETRPLPAPRFRGVGQVQDAYLAAMAEEPAQEFALPVPGWTGGEERRLHKPWLASPVQQLSAPQVGREEDEREPVQSCLRAI